MKHRSQPVRVLLVSPAISAQVAYSSTQYRALTELVGADLDCDLTPLEGVFMYYQEGAELLGVETDLGLLGIPTEGDFFFSRVDVETAGQRSLTREDIEILNQILITTGAIPSESVTQ